MSGPPPPPKRKNHKAIATYGGSNSMIPVAVGSGHNVARAIQENNNHQAKLDTQSRLDNQARLAKLDSQRPAKQKKARICQIHSEPDAIIGSGVEIHGDFQFDKLVRIDGKFQGNLFSHNRGDIIVGKNGCIIGDVIVARRMIVEGGHVLGKVVVDELLLLDRTIIKGDVTCKLIQIVGPDVTITGRANIHPQAPELIDEYNNIITEVPKKAKKVKKDIYPTKSPLKTKSTVQISSDPESPTENDSIQSQPKSPVRAAAVQTNASAKPSKSKNNNLNDEESLALEAAQAERNAAKERHKQNKLAKKNGESPVEAAEPVLLPVSPAKPSAATAPLPSKENKTQPKSTVEEKETPPVVADKAPKMEPKPSATAKSPSKLLPPSADQRKAQLEQDLKTSLGDEGNNGTDKNDPNDEEEQHRAAVNLQRIARGRKARQASATVPHPALHHAKSSEQVDVMASLTEAPAEEDAGAEEEKKQRQAAINLQKIARGKAARSEVANRRKGGGNEPDVTAEAAEAPVDAPAEASVEVPAEAEVETGKDRSMEPGGVGYTEALLG
mmetsp:Transcript_19453/g.33713  ORF Transcript_19453/g.33713 Transcript_19453/m.33713 type:complete len:555 (-) Transcript_19453:118-1782(-)